MKQDVVETASWLHKSSYMDRERLGKFLGPVVFSGTFCKRLVVFCSEDSSTLFRMFYGAFGMYDKGCIGGKVYTFWLVTFAKQDSI